MASVVLGSWQSRTAIPAHFPAPASRATHLRLGRESPQHRFINHVQTTHGHLVHVGRQELSLVGVSVGRAPLRSCAPNPPVNPSTRSEGFRVGIGAAGPPVLVPGDSVAGSACTHASVWTQPDTALPRPWSSTAHVDVRWSLVLLSHNRRFQVFRPAVPGKSSHFFTVKRHVVQDLAFGTPSLFLRMATLGSCTTPPKNTHKRNSSVVFHLKPCQAPRCVSNQPRCQDAVTWQFLWEILE